MVIYPENQQIAEQFPTGSQLQNRPQDIPRSARVAPACSIASSGGKETTLVLDGPGRYLEHEQNEQMQSQSI